jgi:hypothetical protein
MHTCLGANCTYACKPVAEVPEKCTVQCGAPTCLYSHAVYTCPDDYQFPLAVACDEVAAAEFPLDGQACALAAYKCFCN